MTISVFDLFSIGIGPSSSHTVGPMRAGAKFVLDLKRTGRLTQVQRVTVDLYGSLALTGKGHGTDRALVCGLEGELPEDVLPETVFTRAGKVRQERALLLAGEHRIAFDLEQDVRFLKDERLPLHSNALRLSARGAQDETIAEEVYYSIGGGFVIDSDGLPVGLLTNYGVLPPYQFKSAQELLDLGRAHNLRIRDIILENESVWRSRDEIRTALLKIARVMAECINAGLIRDGTLPGGLKVARRATGLYRKLLERERLGTARDFQAMDWLSVYAIAVNEENAAYGRVVTAPTNGAAGIIPAVLRYYVDHTPGATEEGIIDFLLTAGAIGILYKEGASLSAAEVGCQGEVGVACSMAAGAFAAVLGGTNEQIENAAEIGMEHNLGLSCDPIGGLVQIPCIERNAMAAVKAVNAARLALQSDGTHVVSLDKVIAVMRKTGEDMLAQYKETSLGGLAVAVAVPEC